jgi:hypothetical protein
MVGLTVHAGSRPEWHGCFCSPNILHEERPMPKAKVLAIILLPMMTLAANVGARVPAAQTFVATASVKTAAGASITAPVTIVLSRWTSDAEREKAIAALKQGEAALKTALEAMPEIGTIQLGGRTTPVRFARSLDTAGGGKLVTIVAAEPILHLGAGVPEAKPKAGHPFAFATFEVDATGKGTAGDLAPAATLKIAENGALVVDDYGTEAVRLTAIATK